MSKQEEQIQEPNIQRRSFIKKLWVGLGILAGIEISYLIGSFLFPKKKSAKKESEELFIAGNIKDFKHNSVTPFRNHSFFLSRLKDGGFLALSIKCTHLGCNIIWEEESNRFVCPCHSSWFTTEGDVMQTPATRPLSTHPVIIDKGVIKVNTQIVMKRNSMDDTEVVYADKRRRKA